MKKHILYQSDYELHAFFVKGKKITEVQRFQTLNNFDEDFTQYLSRNPKTPIYWLVDTTQEAYQTTLLPHVFGKDRRELMAYKMRRLFEKSDYTYGIVQGRETQGRKDDRVLFMALNDPNFLEPWLSLIISKKIPLAGIYSLPLLSQHLLKHLPQAPYTLLVTDTPYSENTVGLRQTFFINQKLQFSRLISLNISNIQERIQEILNQITTTQRYLDSERLLPESEPPQVLSVIILTDSQTCHVFNKQPPQYDSSTLNIHVLDSSDLKIGIKADSDRALYLHDFVANQISRSWFTKNHYASTIERRYSFYRHLRKVFYFTSILLLSGATAKSALLLQDANSLKEKGSITVKKTKSRQAEIEKLREKLPRSDLKLDILLMRNIVDVGYHLKAQHLSPQPALEKISHILNRHNDLFIQQVKWDIRHLKTALFETNSKTMKSEERNHLFKELDFSKNFIESIRLQGKIDNFQGNYLKASRTFKQFIKDLQRHFWKINVLLEPYNSNQVLQGKIDSEAEVGEAPFTVELFIKHAYP
jgi:hypothetical protein